jgi:hypothetical protein
MATTGFITAFILVSVAVAFLGGTLYFWLVSLALAPPWAALLVAAAGLGLAALIMFAARMISGRRRTIRVAEARPCASPGLRLSAGWSSNPSLTPQPG